MELFVILVGVLFAVAFLAAGLLDVIAAVGGTVPGDRSQEEDLVVGIIAIAMLRRMFDGREEPEAEDENERIPMESDLPPEVSDRRFRN